MMKEIKGQIVASTHVDLHGESLSLEQLQIIACSSPPIVPLNVNHDMSIHPCGEMTNFRIVKDPKSEGHFFLVCDAKYDSEAPVTNFGGFSWSFLEGMYANSESPEFELYLPYPQYKNHELVDSLLATKVNLMVGKWVKKSADPLAVGLIVLAATPFWNSIYKVLLQSKVEALLSGISSKWPTQVPIDISFELPVDYYSPKPTATLSPDRSSGISALHTATSGIDVAMDFCAVDYTYSGKPISKLRLSYNSAESKYQVKTVEYQSGETLLVN